MMPFPEKDKYWGPYADKSATKENEDQKTADQKIDQKNYAVGSPCCSPSPLFQRSNDEWSEAVCAFLKSRIKYSTIGIHWDRLATTIVDEFLEAHKIQKIDSNELQSYRDQCLSSVSNSMR